MFETIGNQETTVPWKIEDATFFLQETVIPKLDTWKQLYGN